MVVDSSNIPEREYLVVIFDQAWQYSRSGINRLQAMAKTELLPYGKVSNSSAMGNYVRAWRKAQGATQADFAALCGVGTRFISELENGKPTVELGKVIKVLQSLGLELAVQPRGWNTESRHP